MGNRGRILGLGQREDTALGFLEQRLYNNSYADTTITVYNNVNSTAKSTTYGTVFTELTVKGCGVACSSYANCYVGCTCAEDWSDIKPSGEYVYATDQRYGNKNSCAAVNTSSSASLFDEVNTIDGTQKSTAANASLTSNTLNKTAASSKSSISTMAVSDGLTCYKAACPLGYYLTAPNSTYFTSTSTTGTAGVTCYMATGCQSGYASSGVGEGDTYHGVSCKKVEKFYRAHCMLKGDPSVDGPVNDPVQDYTGDIYCSWIGDVPSTTLTEGKLFYTDIVTTYTDEESTHSSLAINLNEIDDNAMFIEDEKVYVDVSLSHKQVDEGVNGGVIIIADKWLGKYEMVYFNIGESQYPTSNADQMRLSDGSYVKLTSSYVPYHAQECPSGETYFSSESDIQYDIKSIKVEKGEGGVYCYKISCRSGYYDTGVKYTLNGTDYKQDPTDEWHGKACYEAKKVVILRDCRLLNETGALSFNIDSAENTGDADREIDFQIEGEGTANITKSCLGTEDTVTERNYTINMSSQAIYDNNKDPGSGMLIDVYSFITGTIFSPALSDPGRNCSLKVKMRTYSFTFTSTTEEAIINKDACVTNYGQ